MYTHLAQFQSCCWKYWDISVPYALFEKKEFDRISPSFLGWWGPAKGVPMLVFVASDVLLPEATPATIKKMQEALQQRIKNIFRATHLIPSRQEPGNSSHAPVDVKSLFLLPSTSQPIIHIIPSIPKPSVETEYTLDEPLPISSYLEQLSVSEPGNLNDEYGDKLLRNFVTIWTKTAVNRHPLHRKMNDVKYVPLPTPIQFASSVVPLLHFLFNQPMRENNENFRDIIIAHYSSTKGMIQQIEVILRKKIKDNIEIERVFSKNYCYNVMQHCQEAYLQDSPPFYPEKYHAWKRDHALRLYASLARGPCKEEYASRLERECDLVWKENRQSCEHLSLTGRSCRLKTGHESIPSQSQKRDDRAIMTDSGKHSSGVTFFHACNCGRTQKLRDDPFDIMDANVKFYQRFTCCLGKDRAALDIKASVFGDNQHLELRYDDVPADDSALLLLGPASVYKNNVGLDNVEGFLNNTNYLIPWSITTVNDLKLYQQEQVEKKAKEAITTVLQPVPNQEEWPVLGKAPAAASKTTKVIPAPTAASLEAFPALGTNPPPVSTPAITPEIPVKQLFEAKENSNSRGSSRRRRYNRMRDRLQGLIRGYIGAEYECAQGHRFLSCGEGRVCKIGHAGHPKEHGNYFVHQDLNVFILCPCCYTPSGNGSNAAISSSSEVTAQLMRLYVVTPDEDITISIEPKIKINIPGSDKSIHVDLGIRDPLYLGPGGAYVLRLPFIYRDENGLPIPIETDIERRMASAVLQKDYIKFHYKKASKWALSG
ncbi:hypothetical protein BCV71DRAFT_273060 [Rhizopus microsporus]|uniref:Nonsense-mediated mRNA decay factor SMG8 n=2 Tax=Rhizopus TaxID=4842 RepID=A0A1X0SCT8_RHIZD|nr:hypothetical protein BCV71DRAFT_273060 [Rhizopus microsporus]